MTSLSFKPKQVSKRLLASLPEKARDVLTKRFGLGEKTERLTLEAIGKEYGITRERVRQVESFAINLVKKSKSFEKEKGTFDELYKAVIDLGGIVSEEDLLKHLTKDDSSKNHIYFMLVLGDAFQKEKENEQFKHRWVVDKETADKVHQSLKKIYENLTDEDIMPEGDMVASFLEHLKDVSEKYKNEEIIKRWLLVSKKIGKNELGEWGLSNSPHIKARGIRDHAYLVIRRHGNPMHFTEVAKSISKLFSIKAHVATCHNELIKDPRFVLVGRGLYALSEWGYVNGVVKDVIREILKEKSLSKDEIVDKVMKERYVKKNTIIVNLQNSKFFKKDKAGKYSLA